MRSDALLRCVIAFAALGLACRSAPKDESPTSQKTPARALGGDRPVQAFRPASGTTPAPLVLVLHGYGADGASQLDWFGLSRFVGVHLVAPDGTLDSTGRRFWNATERCCDFEGTGVDDVRYLTSLIDDIAARHPVDRARVYAIGLSNGGAMALRLGCDASERIAAVVSFASPWFTAPACTPRLPFAIRHLHGTGDRVVPYQGGGLAKGIHPNARGGHLSAHELVASFAKIAGCSGPLVEDATATIDLDRTVPGEETTVARHGGCSAPVELWTLRGSGHVPPPLRDAFAEETWRFLSAQHR